MSRLNNGGRRAVNRLFGCLNTPSFLRLRSRSFNDYPEPYPGIDSEAIRMKGHSIFPS